LTVAGSITASPTISAQAFSTTLVCGGRPPSLPLLRENLRNLGVSEMWGSGLEYKALYF
jgi:hypothetical protein